jgi:hypothetical protein
MERPVARTRRTGGSAAQLARIAQMSAALPLAAATTLAYRLPMLWAGLADPRAWNHREMAAMVGEKLVAAGRVSAALLAAPAASFTAGQRYLARQASANLQLALAAGRPDAACALARHGSRSLALLAGWLAETAEGATQMAHAAARPVHDRAVANARRLSARAAPGRPRRR